MSLQEFVPRNRATVLVAAMFAVLGALPAHAQAGNAPPDTAARAYRQVTDETGRHINVPQPVRRIVSLAPNLTETLYALGVEERLVGDTDYCDYPLEAQTKPRVGGGVNPNLEQVVALKPDLVLVTTALNRRETVAALERLGVPTYATDPRSVENILVSIERLADVLGVGERGEALVAKLRERLADLSRRLENRAPKRVLFIVWTDPLISIGRDAFLADALRRAGAQSVVDSTQDWPRLSLEEVVRIQPDFLVLASGHPDAAETTLKSLSDLPGWRSLEAIRGKRIAVISDAVNRPAPRLVDAIGELARQLHPEAFTEPEEKPKSLSGPGGKSREQEEPCAEEEAACGR
jgi:iron complex transport system substrate-binding protein